VITVTMMGSDKKVSAALDKKRVALQAAIRSAVGQAMLELLRRVQQKLSGEVLHQRSGKLLGSAHVEPVAASAEMVSSGVSAAAGPAWYGRVHEYGGKKAYDIFPVNKRALAFFGAGTLLSGGERRAFYFKQGAQRGTLRPKMYGGFHETGGVVVKSVHHPPLPMRSFMRTSLEEMRAQIIAKVLRAAAEAIRS
jgi:hypothetical protein